LSPVSRSTLYKYNIWRYSQAVRHESANVLSIAFKVLNLKGYKNSGGIRVGKRTKEIII